MADPASSRPYPAVEGVTHSHHQAGEVSLHVAEAGEGAPVLCLHGWPQHWYEWRHLIPALAPHYRVVCPDLRGFGWSEAPAGGYDKETLAGDILALADELGFERFRLIGHDWGGWVAFLISVLAPERVERCLALNIPPPFTRLSAGTAATLWRFWYQWVISAPLLGERAVGRLGKHSSALSGWLGEEAWSEEEARIFLGQFAEPARARASVLLYRSFVTREIGAVVAGRYRKSRLRTPTLLLYGTRDRVVRPEHIAGYEDYADEMEVEYVDCGHFIAEERPELVADRALAFLGAG